MGAPPIRSRWISPAVDVLVRPEEVKLAGVTLPELGDRFLGITKVLTRERAAVKRRFHPHVIPIMFQMSTIFQKRLSSLTMKAYPPDVLIQPDFSPDPPRYSDVKNGIEAGAIAAQRALPQIRRAIAQG